MPVCGGASEEPSFEVQHKVIQLMVNRIVVEDSRVIIEHVVPTGRFDCNRNINRRNMYGKAPGTPQRFFPLPLKGKGRTGDNCLSSAQRSRLYGST